MNVLRSILNFRRGWLIILGLILLGLLPVQSCAPAAQDIERQLESPPPSQLQPAARVGRLAPDFTLTDLEGNRITLSDFRGKVVLINFWASWCPPCRAEMPDIEAVYQEYKDKGVVVVGIDIREPEDIVRQFVADGGYSWTFVLDTTGAVASTYAITAIPTSFFLDKEGVIQAARVGAMTKRQMEIRLATTMK